jgi:hypothetical protein
MHSRFSLKIQTQANNALSPNHCRDRERDPKWWAVNVGTFETDFTKIVSPELAANIMSRLRQGEIVQFPNLYELSEVKDKFGGCFMD